MKKRLIAFWLVLVMMVCQFGILPKVYAEEEETPIINCTLSFTDKASNNFSFTDGDVVRLPIKVTYTLTKPLDFVTLQFELPEGAVLSRDMSQTDPYWKSLGNKIVTIENSAKDESGEAKPLPAGTYTHYLVINDPSFAVNESGKYTIRLSKVGYQVPGYVEEGQLGDVRLNFSTESCGSTCSYTKYTNHKNHKAPCEHVRVVITTNRAANATPQYSMPQVSLQYYVYLEEKPDLKTAIAELNKRIANDAYYSGGDSVFQIDGENGWSRQIRLQVHELDESDKSDKSDNLFQLPNGEYANARLSITFDNKATKVIEVGSFNKGYSADDKWTGVTWLFDFEYPSMKAYTDFPALKYSSKNNGIYDVLLKGSDPINHDPTQLDSDIALSLEAKIMYNANPSGFDSVGLAFLPGSSVTAGQMKLVQKGRFQAQLAFDVDEDITNHADYKDGKITIGLGNDASGNPPTDFRIVSIMGNNRMPWLKIGSDKKSLVIERAKNGESIGTGTKTFTMILDIENNDSPRLGIGATPAISVESFDISAQKFSPPIPGEGEDPNEERFKPNREDPSHWKWVSFDTDDINIDGTLSFLIIDKPIYR